ncbi:hypothetical protein ACROYT_G035167 [Oculina patagonica]
MQCEKPAGGFLKIILLLKLLLAISLWTEAARYIQTARECDIPIELTGDRGNFTSPGGYEGYPNNTNCSWVIKGDYNAKINITFHDFDLELSKTCLPYDYVKVSDMCNKSKTWSKNLGTGDNEDGYCGNMTSFTVTSRCQKVRVQFKSDDSITGRGFNATFEIIPVPKPPEILTFCLVGTKNCSESLVVTETFDETLKCEVSASPEALVYWSYLGSDRRNANQPLDTRERRMIDNHDGSLRIRGLRRNDTGYYRCYANNSEGDDELVMHLRVKEKCKCPKVIKANWYDIPPYIRDEGSDREPSGLFPMLLQTIIPLCCGNCSEGDGPSSISYIDQKENLVAIKNIRNFETDDTITFPISGKKEDRFYQNDFKFMPLVGSPGVAFIVVDEPPGTSANAVFQSVLSGWPVLLLTLMMALLSGIIMWGLDTWYNPDEFPRSFIKGSGEGFWWAFVTMTTVGYGDRSPRGFVARIFAIVWVLVGLVITSIFTGVVTTSLTAITLSTDVKLYGTKIAAVANSTEYRLGLNKNANMTAYHDLQAIVEPLKNRENGLKGVLVDTYVAGEMSDFSSEELRVNKIIDHNSYYGIVFGGGKLEGREFQTCFEDYVLSNQADIFETVKQNTQPMSEPSESAAVERSSGLFDATSPLFQNAIYTCLGLLLFFTACGIIWDYGYMRHWKKKAEMDELELLGGPGYEMAKRNLDMMDALMQEVQEFYENWTKRLDDITNKHEEEQRIQAKQKK